MKQLDAVVYNALTAAPGVLSGGGIWKRRAPESTPFPIIVFQQMAGTPSYNLPRQAYKEFVYVVKVIDVGDDNETACDIDAAINVALTDNALEQTELVDNAGTVMAIAYSRRESDIEYEEEDKPGRRLQHVGGAYRFVVVPVG